LAMVCDSVELVGQDGSHRDLAARTHGRSPGVGRHGCCRAPITGNAAKGTKSTWGGARRRTGGDKPECGDTEAGKGNGNDVKPEYIWGFGKEQTKAANRATSQSYLYTRGREGLF
jgi:hypothetical protein